MSLVWEIGDMSNNNTVRLRKSMTFKLPSELEDLIATGHWPTEGRHVKSQNSEAIVPRELVRQVFPNESLFCFCLPPFPALSEIQG